MGEETQGAAVAESTGAASAGSHEAPGDGSQPEAPTLDPLQPYSAPRASQQDDDDDDDPIEGFVREPPSDPAELAKQHRALANALRKTKGRTKKAQQQLRELEARTREYEQKARQYDRLEELARQNPRIRAIFGDDESDRAAQSSDKAGKVKKPADDDFDEASVPFSAADSEINKWFIERARDDHRTKADLSRRLERLEQAIQGYEARDQQHSARQVEQSWVSVTEAAAAKIPHEGVRKLFINAMKGFYDLSRTNPKMNFDPRVIAQHHLKELGVSLADQRRANAAVAQRMAEGNTKLPRAAAMAGGTPAPATGDRGRERLRDVHKRFLSRGA